jgi:hypothetical protein
VPELEPANAKSRYPPLPPVNRLHPTPSSSSNQPASSPSPSSSHQPVTSPSPSFMTMSREEMRDKIAALTSRLQEKEEELRVTLRWKQEAEDKLEDIKDTLRNVLNKY